MFFEGKKPEEGKLEQTAAESADAGWSPEPSADNRQATSRTR